MIAVVLVFYFTQLASAWLSAAERGKGYQSDELTEPAAV
jgi:hypothetical protein